MRNTKKCSKCNSENIVMIQNDGHPDATHGNNIQTKLTMLNGVIFVKRYVCCNCGFTEDWIDKKDIELLINSKKIR